MIRITEATDVDEELESAFERLVPQLSRSNAAPDRDALDAILASPAQLLLARDEKGEIVGTLTLVVFRIPTGLRCRIEDVIVEESARGQGIGEALTRAAIERARKLGAPTVDLTSNPMREAANRLYRRIGFQSRETNIYRLDL